MKGKTMPHPFKIGNTTILVHNDEFADGYTNGLVAHPEAQQGEPVSVEVISELVAESFLDVSHTRDWNIGYLIGAIDGIRLGNVHQQDAESPYAHLGAVTLCLNRWRFREGYRTGQEDYHAGQQEQMSPPMLTARDLLRYIAHRNSHTDMHYFSESELNTLEETLGQLIGYLCAALFPVVEQVEVGEVMPQHTESLPVASLQEA